MIPPTPEMSRQLTGMPSGIEQVMLDRLTYEHAAANALGDRFAQRPMRIKGCFVSGRQVDQLRHLRKALARAGDLNVDTDLRAAPDRHPAVAM